MSHLFTISLSASEKLGPLDTLRSVSELGPDWEKENLRLHSEEQIKCIFDDI